MSRSSTSYTLVNTDTAAQDKKMREREKGENHQFVHALLKIQQKIRAWFCSPPYPKKRRSIILLSKATKHTYILTKVFFFLFSHFIYGVNSMRLLEVRVTHVRYRSWKYNISDRTFFNRGVVSVVQFFKYSARYWYSIQHRLVRLWNICSVFFSFTL